jgi:hypothetical protein
MNTTTTRTTIYLYRGQLITWCRITWPDERTRFITAWQLDDVWYQSEPSASIDDAVRDAERAIDRQLAARPAQLEHCPSSEQDLSMVEPAW